MSDERITQVSLEATLEENKINLDPGLVRGVELPTALTFISLLHLSPEEQEARMEENDILLSKIANGERVGQPAVEQALHYDALHHIGTMVHLSFLTEDSTVMKLDGVPEQLRKGTDFHFVAAVSALDGFISRDPKKITEHLDTMIGHLHEELDHETLPEHNKQDVRQELDKYTLLRSQLKINE